jgi:predicted dienelactone hydrolase
VAVSVGCRVSQVSAGVRTPLPVIALYPSFEPARKERMGPYTLDVAMNGAMEPGRFPVVVISHGSGGAPFTHRLLGAFLAREGFVVLLPEHPGNNRSDNSLANTEAILEQRPRDVRAAVDWAASADGFGEAADATRVGIVGHSLGGYTALALAGGHPMAFAHETSGKVPRAVVVAPDDRVAALVLFAPATPWFMAPGALSDVRVPILLLTAEHDPHTPAEHASWLLEGLPRGVGIEHRVVQGAGHYSFLAPFPSEMSRPGFPPSQDPPGFDRVAFHDALYPEVAAFLGRCLV